MLYSVGFNDASYCVEERIWHKDGSSSLIWSCPFYKKWRDMLKRCYSNSKAIGYLNAEVCSEWLTFSNFKSWMETQDWEGKELDKDLLGRNNKFYSAETCCFLSDKINRALSNKRTNELLGVFTDKRRNTLYSHGSNFDTQKVEYLGKFQTKIQAHHAWLNHKSIQIDKMIISVKENDSKIIEAFNNIKFEILSGIQNGKICKNIVSGTYV